MIELKEQAHPAQFFLSVPKLLPKITEIRPFRVKFWEELSLFFLDVLLY